MSDLVRLESGTAVAAIAPLGAELRHWTVDGVAMIWQPDASIWSETAPILFPVVGWTRGGRISVEGRSYPLGLHGFARTMPFVLAARGADHARFRLETSAASLALYPFAFSLSVTYRLDGATLTTTLDIENRGATPMPYACGLHPGFRWPFAGGAPHDYAVVFARTERRDVPVITADGLFTRARRPLAWDGRRLALADRLFAGEALCFLDARSDRLRFVHADGAALDIGLQDFPHIALWSRPAGRFLSIEAWTGHGDTHDADDDFARKPSMIVLGPGARRRHAAVYRFTSSGSPFFGGDSPDEI